MIIVLNWGWARARCFSLVAVCVAVAVTAVPARSDDPQPEVFPASVNRAMQRIEKALQGEDAEETGDLILDETLRVIRQQGSVLDRFPETPSVVLASGEQCCGSGAACTAKDTAKPRQDQPIQARGIQPSFPHHRSPHGLPIAMPPGAHDGGPLFVQEERGARRPPISDSQSEAAETLLRAARLLTELPHQDPQRLRLVEQLRDEALRCLAPPHR